MCLRLPLHITFAGSARVPAGAGFWHWGARAGVIGGKLRASAALHDLLLYLLLRSFRRAVLPTHACLYHRTPRNKD